MTEEIGRWKDLIGSGGPPETSHLEPGMDFRLPQYRREVFIRFYEFHLRHRAHPGGVYYVMPYLAERLGWDEEQKLWYAYINGCTQNPVTSFILFSEFPRLDRIEGLEAFFNSEWARLPFDTDRRYQKKDFPSCASNYLAMTRPWGQADYFAQLMTPIDTHENFRTLWKFVRKDFLSFGRLATFSYLEYLRIMGLPLDCDNLFLEDLGGSKSHRNGLAIVLGRDDLDWRKEQDVKYSVEQISWLRDEGQALLLAAHNRFRGAEWEKDISYFTLESTLCCYKSWHRPRRRYPNVYNDMLHDRIRQAEKLWPERDFSLFWEARRASLPIPLRLEDNPWDKGLCPEKQNLYLTTGQVPMMDYDWPCFENTYNRKALEEARA